MKKNTKIQYYTFSVIILLSFSFFCIVNFANAANCPGTCRGACNSDEGILRGYADNCSWYQACCVPSSSQASANKCPGTCRGACNDNEDILRGFAGNCGLTEACCVTKSNVSSTFGGVSDTSGAGGTANGAYRNQEKIPGFGQTTSFPTYLKQIVNFGFAAIGIMAMFMLMIGAYQYLMAAGNIAKEESAKTTISSAFSGLILGLVAFLLLRTINPDLVSFNLATLQGGLTGQSGTSSTATTGGNQGTGSGKCEPVASGPCAEANLQSTCLGSSARQASSICNKESGGGSGALSGTDRCQTGESFSVGLFQINLTVHNVGGLNCPSAFSAQNKSCAVTNQALYNRCVQAAQDPATNISAACAVGNNGSNWKPWSTNNGPNGCGF